MFLLNGSRLAEGTAFIANGIQYPANWLNLTTLAEKEAIGITEVDDPVRADDRFYWDGNLDNPKALEDVLETKEDGSPLYVQVYDEATQSMVDTSQQVVTKGLKSNFIAQVKQAAGSILAQTDWMVIRKADRSVDIPASVVTYRAAIVAKADELEAAIAAVTTVARLAALNLSFPSED